MVEVQFLSQSPKSHTLKLDIPYERVCYTVESPQLEQTLTPVSMA